MYLLFFLDISGPSCTRPFIFVATAGYCTLECGYARSLCLLTVVLWWVNGAVATEHCLQKKNDVNLILIFSSLAITVKCIN
jgi:hypothetical protein